MSLLAETDILLKAPFASCDFNLCLALEAVVQVHVSVVVDVVVVVVQIVSIIIQTMRLECISVPVHASITVRILYIRVCMR